MTAGWFAAILQFFILSYTGKPAAASEALSALNTPRMRDGHLDTESLPAWAVLNDIQLPAARVTRNILDSDGNSKGGGLVATRDVSAGAILLKVPSELIVSRGQVDQCAKVDCTLRTILDAAESFAKVG